MNKVLSVSNVSNFRNAWLKRILAAVILVIIWLSVLFLSVFSAYGGVTNYVLAPSVNDTVTGKTQEAVAPGALDGLQAIFPFDGHLRGRAGGVVESRAIFRRNSRAYGSTLIPVEPDTPRYDLGKFGNGIFVEYGLCSASGSGSRNQLPSDMAEAENLPKGFSAIGGAGLTNVIGIQGAGAMRIKVTEPGEGVVMDPVDVPLTKRQTLSFYARAQTPCLLDATITATSPTNLFFSREVSISNQWERHELHYEVSGKVGGVVTGLNLSLTAQANATFDVDALSLETHAGYAGRMGMSSWMEPGKSRVGEILEVGRLRNAGKGTIAFWAKPVGSMDWRVLLCIGDGHGWSEPMRLDMRADKRVQLLCITGNSASVSLSDPNAWHYYAVTWDISCIRLFVDGLHVATVDQAPPEGMNGGIILGGVPDNFSPGLRADAIFDELAIWDRVLDDGEILELAKASIPLSASINDQITIEELEPVKRYARDDSLRNWTVRITNRGEQSLPAGVVSYEVVGHFTDQMSHSGVAPSTNVLLNLPWSPVRLMSGIYTMRVDVAYGSLTNHLESEFMITAARVPSNNLQIITWSTLASDYFDLGVTVGGIGSREDGPPVHRVEEANNYRLYSQLLQFLKPDKDTPDELCFFDAAGQPAGVDISEDVVKMDIMRRAGNISDRLALFPDVRYMILNSEQQTLGSMDFRPQAVSFAQERFGLDLTPWMGYPEDKLWSVVHPMGRLSTARVSMSPPADGIVATNNPFYAYHRWWHGGDSGIEVFMNELIIKDVKPEAPHVQTIIEPILRRPAVRPYNSHAISEEWFYYPDPKKAVWVQENLTAAARSNSSRISGMPQFLFKAGVAAPYAGMPAPHLFREAVWHCLARPLGNLTFWSFGEAVTRNSKSTTMTQEEIDVLLGPEPTWEEAVESLQGTLISLWIPELRDEIADVLNGVARPLGALFPLWTNRPRRIAVYHSFAGQLYSNIRWTGNSPLLMTVCGQGLPFDVIFDEDFDDSTVDLSQYEVVIVAESPVVYEPALAPLQSLISGGGKVLVDDYFDADLVGVTPILWNGITEDDPFLLNLEQQLLAQYGSVTNDMFIAAMTQAEQDQRTASLPTRSVLDILGSVSGDISVNTRRVFANVLEADGAHYLTLVNDLREPGRFYGHFEKVLEKGIAQTATVVIPQELGAVAYNLLSETPVMLTPQAGHNSLKVDLPPAGGKVIVLLPAAIVSIAMVTDVGFVSEKETLHITAKLLDADGNPVPGIIPVRVTILNPDGSESDLSHYGMFQNGIWSFDWLVPYGESSGRYQIDIRELASGRSASTSWLVLSEDDPFSTFHYVSMPPAGNDTNGGTGWTDAWGTIEHAVAQSSAGDTIVIGNGFYNLGSTLTIDKELTVIGFGASPEDVIIQPEGGRINLVTLSHTDAVLENITVRNGGRGVYLDGGGTVRKCIISGNAGTSTSGVYMRNGGLVEHCVIRENSSNYTGSGAHLTGAGCILRNSLIINNSGSSGNGFGGGVYLHGSTDAVVENCTIVRNYAWQAGGGIYSSQSAGTVKNSIVMFNRSPQGMNLSGNPVVDNSTILSPEHTRTGTTRAIDPQFMDFENGDYRLRPGSPAIDTGVDEPWMSDATDLDGNPRLDGIVDVGAYELKRGSLVAGLQPSVRSGFMSDNEIVFTGAAEGLNTNGLSFFWDFENDGTPDIEGLDRAVVTNIYSTCGQKTVKVTITNNFSETAVYTFTNAVKIGLQTVYAAIGTNSDTYPYASWNAAASNILDAVDVAVDGTLVKVGAGHYLLDETVEISGAIHLEGVAGASATILDGQASVGCMKVELPWETTNTYTDAVVEGFTICNGRTEDPGVTMTLGGILRHCIISNNIVSSGNGGTGGASLASANGLVEFCLIAENQAQRYGVGGAYLTLGAVMRNCLVYGNWTAGGNAPGTGGVKLRGGTVENCTIVGNYSPTSSGAGGMSSVVSGKLINSIVYFNKGDNGSVDDIKSGGFSGGSDSNLVGVLVANITGNTADPDFVKDGSGYGHNYVPGDYRLKDESPARDNGILQAWMTQEAVDFDENPRVVNGAVDIGAYEWQFPAVTIIVIH